MATLKKIRLNRYNLLRERGLFHFEALQYSKIPMYADTLRLLVKERYKDYTNAGSPEPNSASWNKWVKQVRFEYSVRGWEWNKSSGAWRQYRAYESIWHERNPGKKDKWVSPTKRDSDKRYRALNKDFINAQKTKYRARNKTKIKQYAKEYRLRKRLGK